MGVRKAAAMVGAGGLLAVFAFSTVIEPSVHGASDQAALAYLSGQSLTAADTEEAILAHADVEYEAAEGAVAAPPGAQGSVPPGDHAAILSGIPNGSMPDELLAELSFTTWKVYRGAAANFEAMNAAYKADTGSDLAINNIYRPGFQGRSFHGWGLAVDFNGPSGTLNWDDEQFHWLMENAHEYGFYLPGWADQGGSNPEPWHWEIGSYYGLGDADCGSPCPADRQFWVKH